MTKILERKSQLIPRVAGFSPPFLDKYRTGMIYKKYRLYFKEYFNRLIKKRANQTNDTLPALEKVNSTIKKVTNTFMGLV